MERFDRKDLELHFRELEQLKQVGTSDSYITEFYRLEVTVTDISKQRLVMLFTEALSEPVSCPVKSFKPETLQDLITRTRDMEDVVPKNNIFSKTFLPPKNKDKKPFQKDGIGKEKLDEATRNELRRNNLFFSCKDPWESGHRCIGKGKAHYIEVLSDNEEEEEAKKEEDGEKQKLADEKTHEEVKSGAITTLLSVPRFHTFKIYSVVQGQRVTILIDGGETHNFIDSTLVAERGIPMVYFEGFDVVVYGGCVMPCT
jgi:hypothetical protein